MKAYQNLFDIDSSSFHQGDSLFSNNNECQSNLSEYNNDCEDRHVGDVTELLMDDQEAKVNEDNDNLYPESKRKFSQARVECKETVIPNAFCGTKRLKISQQASSKTDSVSEKSDRRIASETYKKVKEVEYRQDVIYDKNGMSINYDQDPNEYKRARKRIQNRESAIRSRNRKKVYFTDLEVRVEQLEEENKRLTTENSTLKAEKHLLADQLDYFKILIGNMNHNLSTKTSVISHPRDSSSQAESYDEEKDIVIDTCYEIKKDELPHLGNYKRPNVNKSKKDAQGDDKFVLSRKDEHTISNTAGLFFVAIVMCVLCLTSITMSIPGSVELNTKEINLDNGTRHMMAIQKQQEETATFLRVIMWLMFILSLTVAYITRITTKDTKYLFKKILISCRIIKDNPKKTKYS